MPIFQRSSKIQSFGILFCHEFQTLKLTHPYHDVSITLKHSDKVK